MFVSYWWLLLLFSELPESCQIILIIPNILIILNFLIIQTFPTLSELPPNRVVEHRNLRVVQAEFAH